MSAEGEGENLGDARRTGTPGVALGHGTALTPDAVAPGQQRQAQHGVAQLEDDAQRPEDVHQLRGRGIDPHGAGQKPEEGKYLPGRGVSRCIPQDPAHLRPAVSLLGTLGTGKEVLAPALAPRTLSPVQSGLRWSRVGVRGWGAPYAVVLGWLLVARGDEGDDGQDGANQCDQSPDWEDTLDLVQPICTW